MARYDQGTHETIWSRLRRRGLAPIAAADGHYTIIDLDVIWPTGVYVTTDVTHRTLYVGKATRPDHPTGLQSRIREHPSDRLATWTHIWVLPLRADLADTQIRAVEAWLIGHLNPRQNVQRPAPPRLLPAAGPRPAGAVWA